MRILLVSPPGADPSVPPASLATLVACLRRAGHDVSARDLNLEAFLNVFQEDALAAARQHCEAALCDGEGRISKRRISAALLHAPSAMMSLQSALRTSRSPAEFYRPDRLRLANRVLAQACELLSAAHPGIRFGKYSYSMLPCGTYEGLEAALGQAGPIQDYLSKAVPSFLAVRPDVVGLSVSYFAQLIPAVLLAQLLRQSAPRLHIVAGGAVITWGRHVLRQDPRFSRWFDAAFVGEAEEALTYYVDALGRAGSLAAVPNVIRYVDHGVADQCTTRYVLNLDWPPTPDFAALPLEHYLAPEPLVCLTPTRGCYYNRCAFCDYAFTKLAPYHARSPKLVAEDVERITASTGARFFCFESDVIRPEDLRQLAAALLGRGLDIRWHGVARFDAGLTGELLGFLRRSGCVRLYLGLESGSARVLRAMRKDIDLECASRILRACHEAGIAVEVGVIVGFPTERPEEAEETVRFVAAHHEFIHRVDVGTFVCLRGSPMACSPEEYGLTITGESSTQWSECAFAAPGRPSARAQERVKTRIRALVPDHGGRDVAQDILYCAMAPASRLPIRDRHAVPGSHAA